MLWSLAVYDFHVRWSYRVTARKSNVLTLSDYACPFLSIELLSLVIKTFAFENIVCQIQDIFLRPPYINWQMIADMISSILKSLSGQARCPRTPSWHISWKKVSGISRYRVNIKDIFPDMEISIIKIRRPWFNGISYTGKKTFVYRTNLNPHHHPPVCRYQLFHDLKMSRRTIHQEMWYDKIQLALSIPKLNCCFFEYWLYKLPWTCWLRNLRYNISNMLGNSRVPQSISEPNCTRFTPVSTVPQPVRHIWWKASWVDGTA